MWDYSLIIEDYFISENFAFARKAGVSPEAAAVSSGAATEQMSGTEVPETDFVHLPDGSQTGPPKLLATTAHMAHCTVTSLAADSGTRQQAGVAPSKWFLAGRRGRVITSILGRFGPVGGMEGKGPASDCGPPDAYGVTSKVSPRSEGEVLRKGGNAAYPSASSPRGEGHAEQEARSAKVTSKTTTFAEFVEADENVAICSELSLDDAIVEALPDAPTTATTDEDAATDVVVALGRCET
ncbi:hypothetical protein HPB52_014248 [Rhipicephalus sanguineus]|uniref:Uncharacterized protein n=1 Tax=Rhipicephalus sanguineus TaxID=34632 RepID=A0A9D4T684_RHISA|nr:hypothetical protein HPB52_014248 [Rhipicephalus sanguineus]